MQGRGTVPNETISGGSIRLFYFFTIGIRMLFLAGPCLAESEDVVFKTAEGLAEIFSRYPEHELIFKSSYRKANRTGIDSFTGVGDRKALRWIAEAGKKIGRKTLTDIHTPQEAELAAEYVDMLQIPAFLARQTELITAAAETGLPVNIKKGQFMAAEDMNKAAAKAESAGTGEVLLTERGNFFGYHDLVVDFRNLLKMKETKYRVLYDATHSVQLPSIGDCSGGLRQYAKQLALAAVTCGIDGIFFETHPDPDVALCDASTQLPLSEAAEFVREVAGLCNYLEISKQNTE